jgi:histidinol-phosphate aminotransferase
MTQNPHLEQVKTLRFYENERSAVSVAAEFGLQLSQIVDFSLNVNPFGPPAASIAAARQTLQRGNDYPDLKLAALRRRLAQRHGVPEDALFFGAGLDDVLKLILQAWVSEGDQVLVHLPTFPRYELEAQLRGAIVASVQSDPVWRIDVTAIRAKLTSARIALAFLCTPNNPTAALIPTDDIAALAADFPDVLFVVDEALIDPSQLGVVPLIGAHRNLIVLRTFSKYFGLAGARVGYAIADPALVSIAELVRPPFNVSLASAAAAAAALDDDDFLKMTREKFDAEAKFVLAFLDAHDAVRLRGRHGNMIFMELTELRAEAFLTAMARQGFLLADGASFHGLEGTHTVRMSLRSRAENQRLVAAMERIFSGAGKCRSSTM